MMRQRVLSEARRCVAASSSQTFRPALLQISRIVGCPKASSSNLCPLTMQRHFFHSTNRLSALARQRGSMFYCDLNPYTGFGVGGRAFSTSLTNRNENTAADKNKRVDSPARREFGTGGKKNEGPLLIRAGQTFVSISLNMGKFVFRISSKIIKKSIAGIKLFVCALREPAIMRVWYEDIRKATVHTIEWLKTGSKLLGKNISICKTLVKKKALGHPLTLREHKLLVRTTVDMGRVIPFSLFIIIPFAELLLPVALKIFPGLLPSTFHHQTTDSKKLTRRLEAKKEMSTFFQEIIEARTKKLVGADSDNVEKAKELEEFRHELLEDVDDFPPVNKVVRFAKMFSKEFTLDSMPKETLQAICKLLGLSPFGLQTHLVLQLRHHMLALRREDREILWEGVENLTHEELTEACRGRVMKFHEIEDGEMRDQLKHWLELSSYREIPTILLLWIRTFLLTRTRAAPDVAAPIVAAATQAIKPEVVDSEAEAAAATKAAVETINPDEVDIKIDAEEMETMEAQKVEKDAPKDAYKKKAEKQEKRAEDFKAQLDDLEKELQAVQKEEKKEETENEESSTGGQKPKKAEAPAKSAKSPPSAMSSIDTPSTEIFAAAGMDQSLSYFELSEISKLERNRLLSRMTSTAEQLMLEKKLVREQSKLLREQMCFLSELRELSFTKGDAKATREKLNSMFAVWQENLDAIEKDMEVADQRWDVFEQALQKEQEEQQKKELEEEERAEKRRKEKEMLKESSDSSSGKKAKIDSVNGSESSDGSVSDGKKIETKS